MTGQETQFGQQSNSDANAGLQNQWSELGANLINDLCNRHKDVPYLPAVRDGERSFIERYAHREFALHMQLFGWNGLGGPTNDYCLSIQFPGLDEFEAAGHAAGYVGGWKYIHRINRAATKMDSAMLVNVVEFMKRPETMLFGVTPALPFLERLELLNDCTCRLADSSNLIQPFTASGGEVVAVSREDGKFGFGHGLSGFLEGEGIDEMVERGSEIVEDFADKNRPTERQLGRDNVAHYFAAGGVILKRDGLIWESFKEISHLGVKRSNLLYCATVLGE